MTLEWRNFINHSSNDVIPSKIGIIAYKNQKKNVIKGPKDVLVVIFYYEIN